MGTLIVPGADTANSTSNRSDWKLNQQIPALASPALAGLPPVRDEARWPMQGAATVVNNGVVHFWCNSAFTGSGVNALTPPRQRSVIGGDLTREVPTRAAQPLARKHMKLSWIPLAVASLALPASAANFMIVTQLGGADPYQTALAAEFPGSTFSTGLFLDHTDAATTAAVAAADVIIFSRDTNSVEYAGSPAERLYWNGVATPIIQSNFLIPRSSRWGWASDVHTTSATPNGSETTLTAAGASYFGLGAGTQDFFNDGANYGTTTPTLTFGDGVLLGTATIGSSVSIVSWNQGDEAANGDIFGGNRLYFAASNSVSFTAGGQDALASAVNMLLIPEPGTALLGALGIGLATLRRRRR